MSIIPGYDFTANEVPLRENFLTAARGLTIDGVSESDLASDVVAVLAGGTDHPLLDGTTIVSSIWVSAAGDIYVREQAGPVKMVRANGGWESTRYYLEPHVTWGIAQVGDPMWSYSGGKFGRPIFEDFDRSMTGHTAATDTVMVRYEELSQNGAEVNIYQGIVQDTGTTGFRPWSGRGATIMHSTSDTAGTYERYCTINMAMLRSNGAPGSVNTWRIERASLAGGFNSAKQQAQWLGYSTTTSSYSDSNYTTRGHACKASYLGWNFGVLQMAKKAIE